MKKLLLLISALTAFAFISSPTLAQKKKAKFKYVYPFKYKEIRKGYWAIDTNGGKWRAYTFVLNTDGTLKPIDPLKYSKGGQPFDIDKNGFYRRRSGGPPVRWEKKTIDKSIQTYQRGDFWYKRDKNGQWQLDISKENPNKLKCFYMLPDSTLSPNGCMNQYKKDVEGFWDVDWTIVKSSTWKKYRVDTVKH